MKRTVDFGSVASDYEHYRPGFPSSFYSHVDQRQWIHRGERALDLGTGTGHLALGLASRGLSVVGLDPCVELLTVARRRAQHEFGTSDICFVEGTAESTGMKPASFDLVCAGQCWWWFDAKSALREVRRVLKPNGRILVACFSYLPTPGSVAARTEDIILKHNPNWNMAGTSGMYPSMVLDLDVADVRDVETMSYVEVVTFSHESWRGRVRASNGVGVAMTKEVVARFDKELADVLSAEFPATLKVSHRVFIATGVM